MRENGCSIRYLRYKGDKLTLILCLFSFQKIREPFLEAVKITLGDRYTEYMANVYSVTIDFILESLTEGYVEGAPFKTQLDNGGEATNNCPKESQS